MSIDVTVTEADKQAAKDIVIPDAWELSDPTCMEYRIALALATARAEGRKAPKGCVLDDEGRVLRVDMTHLDISDPERQLPLPVFADGQLWMMNQEYYFEFEGEVCESLTDYHPTWTSSGWVIRCGDEGEIELNKCYSTPEAAQAALAAKEARDGK